MGYDIPSDHHESTPAARRAEIPKQYSMFDGVNELVKHIHKANVRAGWWTDIRTGQPTITSRNIGEILMLIVSEIAEAMEGHRKGLMDDKLPHRSMLEVELADACIRIFDLAGAKGFDLAGAIREKMRYNETRADHKIENRIKPGGKKY